MINKIQEILNNNYDTCLKTITCLSYDEDNQSSLCNSLICLYDYDNIVKQLDNDSLCSPDSIWLCEDKALFIEFKNGCIKDSKAKMKIKLKGIEGGFICLYEIVNKYDDSILFSDIVKLPKEYMVVYNSGKNNSRIGQIKNHLDALTEIRFGLEKYNGTFFLSIKTISETVFLNNILGRIGVQK